MSEGYWLQARRPINSIDVISFSRIGGAGRVSEKLVEGYRTLGINSNFIFKLTENIRSQWQRAPLLAASATIDEILVKNGSTPAMVSVYRSIIPTRSIRSEAQVLQVRWAPGFIDPFALALAHPEKIIAWSLPDEYAYTGGCHYAMSCEGYKLECKNCPVVRPAFRGLIANSLSKKRVALDKVSNLVFTAPSQWLADRAMQSSLLGGARVAVIPNPVNDIFFEKQSLEMSESSKTKFLFVAEDTGDPIKGLDHLLSAFETSKQRNSAITLTVVGKKSGSARPVPGVNYVGRISQESLASVMRSHDALIMASAAEAAGTTVAEASAAGIPSIISRVGGMSENAGGGALFFRDFQDLSDILASVEKSQLRISGVRARKFAVKNFAITNVARRYVRLFSQQLEELTTPSREE